MQVWMTPFLACALIAGAPESHAQSKPDTTIQKITIKYSGFRKDEEFTIWFKKKNYDIVEVLNSGRAVPEDSFYVYEPLLHDYLHFRGLENVVPRIEKLKREVIRRKVADSTRLREAIRIKRDLDSLDIRFDRHADSLAYRIARSVRINKKEMDSLRTRIDIERDRMSDRISRELKREVEDVREELEYQMRTIDKERSRLKVLRDNMEVFLDALLEEGLISSKEGVRIKNNKGKCRINGRKLTKEETEKVKQLWNRYLDHPFEEADNCVIQL